MGANMCPPSLPKHTQDHTGLFTSTGHRSSYTTLLGALECQSERRKLDSFCCAPTVTCELVGLLLCTLQHCSMKKGCLQTCQAAPLATDHLQNLTLPHLTRLSYAKQLCQRRILVDPAFLSAELRYIISQLRQATSTKLDEKGIADGGNGRLLELETWPSAFHL